MDVLDSPQLIVISIQDHAAVLLHIGEDFCLRAEHAVPVPEELQMAGPDIGDDHDVRIRDPGKPGHIPEMTHAHLKHGDLMFIPQPEDSQRKSEIIVEVSFGLQRIELHRQDRGDHLFGRSLAHRARDPDHRDLHDSQILPRDLLKCALRITHFDPRAHQRLLCPGISKDVLPAQSLLREDAQSPLLIDGCDVIVSVHPGSNDGAKQRSRLSLSTVGGDGGDLHAAVLREGLPRRMLRSVQGILVNGAEYSAGRQHGQMQCPSCHFRDPL